MVIGFSQGGGAALVHAADMPEVVSAVVAYYPQTNFVADASLIARRFQVPVLILAGQRDTYHNCCLIDSMRAIERGARERSAVFELVVYPYAEHGFNLQRSAYYRGDDEADAWKRTVEMLMVDDDEKIAFLSRSALVDRLYKAILPDIRANEFSRIRAVAKFLADGIAAYTERPDVSGVLGRPGIRAGGRPAPGAGDDPRPGPALRGRPGPIPSR